MFQQDCLPPRELHEGTPGRANDTPAQLLISPRLQKNTRRCLCDVFQRGKRTRLKAHHYRPDPLRRHVGRRNREQDFGENMRHKHDAQRQEEHGSGGMPVWRSTRGKEDEKKKHIYLQVSDPLLFFLASPSFGRFFLPLRRYVSLPPKEGPKRGKDRCVCVRTFPLGFTEGGGGGGGMIFWTPNKASATSGSAATRRSVPQRSGRSESAISHLVQV